jgi:hypothetical protein
MAEINGDRVTKIMEKSLARTPSGKSKADWDKALADARAHWKELNDERPLTITEFLAFHLAWYYYAGHKRLGIMYRQLAQEMMTHRAVDLGNQVEQDKSAE